uniref:Uncharacterized protein n=1 Tax=Megaselia scalaris TaxID=36166 RepID=T1GVK2_MEGSC
MLWIIEKLQEICHFLNNDVKICENLINLFPKIFSILKTNDDCFYDFISIMHNFLQKSFKKYYPPRLVKILILTVKSVARNNRNILRGENFPIAKFLTSSDFEIHLATIECLTALLDPTWIFGSQIPQDEDFLFFNLKLLSQKQNCYILKRSVLSVLWFFFDDFLNYGAEVLKDYLSQITRILISTAESVNESDLQEICLKLLKKLICENYELLGNSIGKIDSFPSTSNYKDLRDIHKKYQNLECSNGLRGDIENLLRDSKRGAEGLKVFKNNQKG